MNCVPTNMDYRRKDPFARGSLRAGIPYRTGSHNHSTIPSSYSDSQLSALLRCPRTNQPGSNVGAGPSWHVSEVRHYLPRSCELSRVLPSACACLLVRVCLCGCACVCVLVCMCLCECLCECLTCASLSGGLGSTSAVLRGLYAHLLVLFPGRGLAGNRAVASFSAPPALLHRMRGLSALVARALLLASFPRSRVHRQIELGQKLRLRSIGR